MRGTSRTSLKLLGSSVAMIRQALEGVDGREVAAIGASALLANDSAAVAGPPNPAAMLASKPRFLEG